MTQVLRLTGTPASPGFARGPLHVLDESVQTVEREPSAAHEEEPRLHAALAEASAELAELIAAAAGAEAQDILEFQVAMLADDTLAAPAFAAIARGAAAGDAWRAAMDVQIADYDDASDPYFRARASDLRDMRDRVLRRLAGAGTAAVPAGAIVVAADLPPSRFLEIPWEHGGIALFEGSPNSHVATLARARGVPMIVSMTRAALAAHRDVLLDANSGVLIASPDGESARAFERRERAARAADAVDGGFLAAPAVTAGGERVRVTINVAHPSDLAGVAAAHCDGIGLVRTELVLRTPEELRDEEHQFALYRDIVAWARGRPITVRTLDAGGDKPIAGYTAVAEANPFLGMRGIRLSLQHPDILLVQLRALARAAALGNVKIMLPMVTQPAEVEAGRALLGEAVDALERAGTACARPELGMMVEVPAAALAIDGFHADFFSIGSNDLIAYVTACSRDSDRLAPLQDPLQPAVMRLIRSVAEYGRSAGIEVSVCGDMASDPRCIAALLDAGVRSLSVAPAALGRVKAATARYGGEALV